MYEDELALVCIPVGHPQEEGYTVSHTVRSLEKSEFHVAKASVPLASGSVSLSTPPRQRQWNRYRRIETVEKEEPASSGDASLVYAGYPYDPFTLDKSTH
jgi:hypothetical protein